MHLFFIRHGECLGQCDPSEYTNPDSVLSASGREQARQVAHRLEEEDVSNILSSPLLRALETAEFVRQRCATSSIDIWLDLREGYSGRHRGPARGDLLQRFPQINLPENITDTGWDHGNDTYDSFCRQAHRIVERLRKDFRSDDRIAVITHGGITNYILHAMLGMDTARPSWFELANGSITHLRVVPNPEAERPDWPLYPPVDVEVLAINDTSHLSLLKRQE